MASTSHQKAPNPEASTSRLARLRASHTRTASEPRPEHPVADGPSWFAVWTRSRHEQVVRSQLDEKHVTSFLPTLTKWSRWRDRRKQIEVPLFPGYVFARFAPGERLSVLKCSGVVSLVSVNGAPVPIPDHEIDSIRTLIETDLQFDPCPLIKEGMLAEVTHGPLRGVVGRLVRKGTHARLVLSVELIGQGVSVEVDAADVRPY